MENENKEKISYTKEEINAGYELVNKEYFMHMLGLASHSMEIKELNYLKTAVVTPDGGTYLISILHVDGPKIDMEKYRGLQVKDEDKDEDREDPV